MSTHETEATSSHEDSMAFLRGDAIQPGNFTTPEGIQDTIDVVGHEVDKLALGAGVGRDLAEALAREKALSMREDQLQSYKTGGTAIDAYRQREAEDSALLTALFSYVDGGEPSEAVTALMNGRIDGIREELQDLGGDFSAAKITALYGEKSPRKVHTIEARLKELAKLNTPHELKEIRDSAGDAPATRPPSPERAAETTPGEGERVQTEAQRLGLPTVLEETPGQYNDRKGAALTLKTMRELGIDDDTIAAFTREIARSHTIFRETAAKIHGDRSPNAQHYWAENQLWEKLQSDPSSKSIWEALAPQITAQGDRLAGRGALLSPDKIMSGFLAFARHVYP